MNNEYTPELGQACFGNPTGEYDVPDYVTALTFFVRDEIDRVYGNVHQKPWHEGSYYEDPEIPGIEWRNYWWGDEDAPEASLPNFSFGAVEIRWYKYPGRGMSVNVDWTPEQWVLWFDDCLKTVRAADSE